MLGKMELFVFPREPGLLQGKNTGFLFGWFFGLFLFLFFVLQERTCTCTHAQGEKRGRGRRRERIPSGLLAEHGAGCGASSHNPDIMT